MEDCKMQDKGITDMTKEQKNLIIAVVLGALIFFLVPAVNGLTDQGVRLLAVFIPTIYLWMTVGGSWASFLSVTAGVMISAYNGVATFTGVWGSLFVAVLIPFFMIATVLDESGALEWIVKWMISRKFVHGRPLLFTIMFSLAILICSIFTVPIVVSVLFFKILKQISKSIGYTREDGFYRAHGMLIAWLAQTCDGCLIWGRAYILSMVTVIVGLGFTNFTPSAYLKIGLIYLALFTMAAILIVVLWIRPDVSKFKNYDDAAIREELKAHPMSKRARIAMGGMVVVLVMYILASITALGPVASYLSGLSIVAPVMLVCGLLCVITADGKPVMNLGEAASKISWPTIVFMGTIMYYAGTVGKAEYGITVFMQNLLAPYVRSIPAYLAFFIAMLIASMITNVASNSVAVIVTCASFVPALLSVPGISEAKVLTFASCVIAICATAFCTYSACATMGVVYCDEGIDYKGTPKYSIILCLIMVILCSLLIVPFGEFLMGAIV